MTHLLDTDHLSILQRPTARERPAIVLNINLQPEGAVTACVISFHEQFRGAHNQINAARTADDVVRAYTNLRDILADYTVLPVLTFDAAAQAVFDTITPHCRRVGTMDRRIAAIALSQNLTVVTRNTRDFSQVPGLRLEDWTK